VDFNWTIISVYRSKDAATQAKEAAERARSEIIQPSTIGADTPQGWRERWPTAKH